MRPENTCGFKKKRPFPCRSMSTGKSAEAHGKNVQPSRRSLSLSITRTAAMPPPLFRTGKGAGGSFRRCRQYAKLTPARNRYATAFLLPSNSHPAYILQCAFNCNALAAFMPSIPARAIPHLQGSRTYPLLCLAVAFSPCRIHSPYPLPPWNFSSSC